MAHLPRVAGENADLNSSSAGKRLCQQIQCDSCAGDSDKLVSFPVRGYKVVAESLKRLQPARYADPQMCFEKQSKIPATEARKTGFSGSMRHQVHPVSMPLASIMAAREMSNHQIKAVRRGLTSLHKYRKKYSSSTFFPDVRGISEKKDINSSVFLRNWDIKVI